MKKLTLLPVLFFSIAANAAFYDRGNGMIYDSEQNITWIQDFNYARNVLGYPNSFSVPIPEKYTNVRDALALAASFEYAGISGWRLPRANLIQDYAAPREPNESFNDYSIRMSQLYNITYDGTTDHSYNDTQSELGHLFHELGNKALYDANGNRQEGYGITQSGPFLNIQPGAYYESNLFIKYHEGEYWSWMFDMGTGLHHGVTLNPSHSNLYYIALVHDGDVASVPIPSAAWLFSAAFISLIGARRKTFRLKISQ